MSRRVCGCGAAYLVTGHPDGEVYICPDCRDGHARIAPTPDLAAQLAAVTAERDEERRLRLLAAAHAAEVQSGYQRDLAALREDVQALVDAFEDQGPPRCHCCKAIATQYGRNSSGPIYTLDRCDAHTDDLWRPGDFSYAPAWRRLVALVRPPDPDPGPAPGTVAWFDKARADLATEGTTIDAADWLIGPDED